MPRRGRSFRRDTSPGSGNKRCASQHRALTQMWKRSSFSRRRVATERSTSCSLRFRSPEGYSWKTCTWTAFLTWTLSWEAGFTRTLISLAEPWKRSWPPFKKSSPSEDWLGTKARLGRAAWPWGLLGRPLAPGTRGMEGCLKPVGRCALFVGALVALAASSTQTFPLSVKYGWRVRLMVSTTFGSAAWTRVRT